MSVNVWTHCKVRFTPSSRGRVVASTINYGIPLDLHSGSNNCMGQYVKQQQREARDSSGGGRTRDAAAQPLEALHQLQADLVHGRPCPGRPPRTRHSPWTHGGVWRSHFARRKHELAAIIGFFRRMKTCTAGEKGGNIFPGSRSRPLSQQLRGSLQKHTQSLARRCLNLDGKE